MERINGSLAHTLLCFAHPQSSVRCATEGIYRVHFPRKTGRVGVVYPLIYLFALPDSGENWALGENICPCLHDRV